MTTLGGVPDQGDHPAEDRSEREWHEGERWTAFRFLGRLHVDRHQEGQRGDVVDDRGERGRDTGHDADVGLQATRGFHQVGGQKLDRAGVHQPTAHDEDECDDDRCRVSEPGEDLVLGQDAADGCDEQCGERDDVVAYAPPDEHAEQRAQEGEEEDLIEGHARSRGRSRWGTEQTRGTA